MYFSSVCFFSLSSLEFIIFSYKIADEAKQVAITILGSSARLIRWELETKEYVARYHMVLDVNGDIMHVVIDANSSQVIEVTKEG